MMLMKNMKGGLGNQFFQYAFMRAVQERYASDAEIVLSFRNETPFSDKIQPDYLQYFKVKYQREHKLPITPRQKFLVTMLSLVLAFYKYIIRKNYERNRAGIERKWQSTLIRANILWWTDGFRRFPFNKINWEKDVLFYGYFESPMYFDGMREILQEELTPQCAGRTETSSLFKMINSHDSVCLHVRRGDFVGDGRHDVCNRDYYERAIALLREMAKDEDLLFVVFSDDVSWVRKNINLPMNTVFESGNDWTFDVQYLMRACRHFIISNSTFSWWAQYLSERAQDETRIVMAPLRWWNEVPHDDIYLEDWILIEN